MASHNILVLNASSAAVEIPSDLASQADQIGTVPLQPQASLVVPHR